MLYAAWTIIMPLVTAGLSAVLISEILFSDRHMLKALMRANEVILSEQELALVREPKSIRRIVKILDRIHNGTGFKPQVLDDIDSMLQLMGTRRKAEREVAAYILNGLVGSSPMILVSLITGIPIYAVLYPLGVCFLVFRQYLGLKRSFRNWQLELVKDLPELIDKLRISFAGGRDYISALIKAKESSGPLMGSIIDKLINDLQYMRYNQALDNFSGSLKIPAATKFAAALKISVEYGYEQAENYFRIIEDDITEIRRAAIEELSKSKPEKVYQLYLLLIGLAVGALALKAWEIFSLVNKII